MNIWRRSIVFIAIVILGLAITSFWFVTTGATILASENVVQILIALVGIASLTTGNLLLRWLRWHFLTRRLKIWLRTKDSFRLYFATLPAIVTPFYIGELLRGLFLSRRYPRARAVVIYVWLIERLADASVLGLLWLAATSQWIYLSISLVIFLGLLTLLWRITVYNLGHREASIVHYTHLTFVLGTSLLAWVLPVLALWGTVRLWGTAILPVTATQAYAGGTLLGGLVGIPLGTGVTGSTAILILQNAGIRADVASLSVALLRTGTAWYALLVGLIALRYWKQPLVELLRDISPVKQHFEHFDEIAAEYASQIPPHVRERLLERKIKIMKTHLQQSGVLPGAKGFDLGCGQGWYACEMAAAGYDMIGADNAPGQIEEAREYAKKLGLHIDFQVMNAAKLDFPDNTFDFAYAINVLHHITDREERRCGLAEIVRVLKPGGEFYLHEMNTENILFRVYLSYIFPLIKNIDSGDERWIKPSSLPTVTGATWQKDVDCFTFVPDFIPQRVLTAMAKVEAWLERSPYRHLSAHYIARLRKNQG